MRVRIRVLAGPRAEQVFVFEERSTLLVGRSPRAELRLADDPSVSACHALLEVNPPRLLLRDLNSTNGTYVNGSSARISEVELHDGDQVAVGETLLDVLVENDAKPLADGMILGLADTVRPGSDASRAASRAAASLRAGERVTVQCGRCGDEGVERFAPDEIEGAVYFCGGCRGEMASEPVVLDGYRVVRRLGQGSMGVVDLAYHEQHGLRALKRMHPQVALSERSRRMFIREANQMAQVRHPNVVELFDLLEPEPGVFVAVLQYVEGHNADKLREQMPGGRLPPAMAVDLVSQALCGLDAMHGKGIVHRDIKEENLLVQLAGDGSLGSVKITDFGLAKSYQQAGLSGLTRVGEISGTVPYMAPEQISNFRDTKPPADLYAMGATLYRLLCGQYAHDFPEGRHPLAVVLMEPIVPLRQRAPSISEELAWIVETALHKEADKRFASAEAMRQALRSLRPPEGDHGKH